MIVVEIVSDIDNIREFLLLVNGAPWKTLNIDIYGKNPQLPYLPSTKEELEEIFLEWSHQQAKRFILKKLARKSLLKVEITQLLKDREVDENIIRSLIKEFSQLGYLDDKSTINYLIQGQKRKKGNKAIQYSLMKRGITAEKAQELVEEHFNEDEQIESVRFLLKKKFPSYGLTALSIKERQKIINYFFSKGFVLNVVLKVIDSHQDYEE